MTRGVLHLLGCGALPVRYLDRPVHDAQARGWEVCLGLTPTAASWVADQLPSLAALTGHPVRVEPRLPEVRDPWPPADVVLVAPTTLNSVNAIALGLTPTWVSAHACEAIGKRWPLAVLPSVNSAFATHPQFGRSVETLRAAGVRVLLGPGGFEPTPPGEGRPERYPWHLGLDAADELA